MTETTIGDVLKNRRMVELAPSIAVSESAKLMRQSKVSAVLVVDEGRLVGVLTERDIVFRVVAAGLDVDRTKVGNVMTRNPFHVTPQTPVHTAINRMRELHIRHLPVIEPTVPPGENQVVGVVSIRDIIGEDARALEREIGEDVIKIVKEI